MLSRYATLGSLEIQSDLRCLSQCWKPSLHDNESFQAGGKKAANNPPWIIAYMIIHRMIMVGLFHHALAVSLLLLCIIAEESHQYQTGYPEDSLVMIWT